MPYRNIKIDDDDYTFIMQNKPLEGESMQDFVSGAIKDKIAEKKAIADFINDQRKEKMRLAKLKVSLNKK